MPIVDSYNVGDYLVAYETDELGVDEVEALFQHLVDTGLAWRLQGHYGRQAVAMIEAGTIVAGGANV